jgi:fructose-bisphosphate aldolase, class I
MNEVETVARAILAGGKRILAADESTASIKNRLDAVGVESTPETKLNAAATAGQYAPEMESAA